jgi:hypothetical protein
MNPNFVGFIALALASAVVGSSNVWAAENRTGSPVPSQATDASSKKSGLLPDKLGIASADLPPAGQCRVWHPGRAANQQPAPGNCEELSTRVPPGAWLLTRPASEADKVHVIVYEKSEPGLQATVGVFEAGSGRFVREITPKTNDHEKVAKQPGAHGK